MLTRAVRAGIRPYASKTVSKYERSELEEVSASDCGEDCLDSCGSRARVVARSSVWRMSRATARWARCP